MDAKLRGAVNTLIMQAATDDNDNAPSQELMAACVAARDALDECMPRGTDVIKRRFAIMVEIRDQRQVVNQIERACYDAITKAVRDGDACNYSITRTFEHGD